MALGLPGERWRPSLGGDNQAVSRTMAVPRRKPFDGKFVNPFTFVKLFTTSPMITKMTLFNMFQMLSEGKISREEYRKLKETTTRFNTERDGEAPVVARGCSVATSARGLTPSDELCL